MLQQNAPGLSYSPIGGRLRYLGILDFGEPEIDQDVDAPIRLWRLTLVAALTGALTGCINLGLTLLFHLITNAAYYLELSLKQASFGMRPGAAWWFLLPAAGGLAVGLIEKYWSKSVTGGGIAAVQAHALGVEREARPKLVWLKPLAAAIAIGTGAPLGREGPTMQAADAAGTTLSPWFGLSRAERRLLIGCAASAAMAATYRTAIAAVLVGIEIALFKIRSRALVPLLASAAAAEAVSLFVLGPGMLVSVPPIHNYGPPEALPLYALLGAGCGLLGAGIYHGLDWARRLFNLLRIERPWRPALAGLAVGIIGLALPLILGTGYATDTQIFYNQLDAGTLGLLLPLKLLAFVIASGGGMAGGMFSPNFMIGASLGSLFARGFNAAAPGLRLDPTAFALAGAGAIFGSASRAPLAFMTLTFELAGESKAIVPFAVANLVAVWVATLLLEYPLQARRFLRER